MSTSGKFLAFKVGASQIAGNVSWSCDEQGDELDETDADSGGYMDTGIGCQGLEFTFEGIVDIAVDGGFPPLAVSALLVNVTLHANSLQSDPDYTIPLAIVTKFKRSAEVRGQIKYSGTAKSKGAFTIGNV